MDDNAIMNSETAREMIQNSPKNMNTGAEETQYREAYEEELLEEELSYVAGGRTVARKTTILYKVVKGDNLTKIAKRFHTTIKDIMELNPIIKDRNFIKVDWVLKIAVAIETDDGK